MALRSCHTRIGHSNKEAHLPMEVIVLPLIFLVIFVLYFIPTIVALKRDHPSKGGIIVVNVFLG